MALNNLPDLVYAHNKHARPDAWRDFDEDSEKGSTVTSLSTALNTKWQETFHFASFLPINGHLFEMDSLKPYPVDHGNENFLIELKRRINIFLFRINSRRFRMAAIFSAAYFRWIGFI